ncbi:MAG: YHYH protein, partial [Bacteroidota bacterium]
FLDDLNAPSNQMTLIGYAADGFPIYYKYAYSIANDANSTVEEMMSGYQLKSGSRPGDGVEAPCGDYNGVYSNDYEYVGGNAQLDEANGRTGVTPEFPGGTYYYVITEDFPIIPRMFRGTPSADFEI